MTSQTQAKYKITNWASYNNALVKRGDVTLWIDEDVIYDWEHANDETKPGRPFIYSDKAITCVLSLREAFRLPYRQTEGWVRSLFKLINVNVAIPDFTSLAKRAKKLAVALPITPRSGPIHVVIDSTGLKVYGEGEWKTRQHGKSKRRTWRKLHLAINPETQEIVAEVLTDNSGHDADQVDDLLKQVEAPVATMIGDGIYDQWKVYDSLEAKQIEPIIPPRRNAKVAQHGNSSVPPLKRDTAIRRIRQIGRKAWKEEIGYHIRSLIETTMFRCKKFFGAELKNRLLETQRTEVRLRCNILNRFTQLGMPLFEWS